MSELAAVISVIGVDPGPSTGLSFIDYTGTRLVGAAHVQCDGKSSLAILEAMLATYYAGENIVQRWAQVEAFVTGQSAGTKGADAEVTRQLAFTLAERLQLWGYRTAMRKKADVSSWATDKRLTRAGILRPPENRHVNDASRHGLYCAVHDARMPDPLR